MVPGDDLIRLGVTQKGQSIHGRHLAVCALWLARLLFCQARNDSRMEFRICRGNTLMRTPYSTRNMRAISGRVKKLAKTDQTVKGARKNSSVDTVAISPKNPDQAQVT